MNAHPPSESIRRVAAAGVALALHDAAASKRLEAAALAGSAPHALMRRAGLAVARLAVAVAPHARRTCVLVGPGNNGGDGLVAATLLHRQGRTVRVLQAAPDAHRPADAALALAAAQEAGVRIETLQPLHGDDELVIDALLGLGTSRAPDGPMADAIAAIARHRAPVLAVDLPSGLDADSGQALGAMAVHANWTLSLLSLKAGLFTGAGRDHAGDVWLDRLGIAIDGEPETAWLGAACSAPDGAFAPRRHAQHKGSFGDVCVVGGAPGMQGAGWLCARAALGAGAGRVYLSPLDDSVSPGLVATPELMLRRQAWLAAPEALKSATVVCGCGGGTAVDAALPPLLSHAGRLVLDADALNALARDPGLMQLLQLRGGRGGVTVLTPHPLEAARLLGSDSGTVQADRLGAARTLARQLGALIVLKGSGTVVARPDGQLWINASGNARLAAAGTGDVLAGWLGGCWAQATSRDDAASAWLAARTAVWLHGRAADVDACQAAPSLPLRATELIEAMRSAAPAS